MTVQAATDLWQMGAAELAATIRSRRASSREVVEAHLGRIESVNPAVNAVVTVLAEQAVGAAEVADRALARGDPVGPLHGVPFTVKASLDLVGTPTTMGLRALADAYPSIDAPAVARLKAAGAIPIGRTNCPSITLRWHTDSELWGPTLNPWDPRRTPGASSGGEAAALATGMSPLGLGSDGLGSLRWPAQCCGVAALKPTVGRVPNATSLEPVDASIGAQITVVVGPMARHVADLRIALEQVGGPTWRDPWTVPAPLHGSEPRHPIAVALVVDPCGGGTARQVREGVRRAGAALADAGYAVDEIEPPSIDAAANTLLTMLNTPDVRALWERMLPMIPADTQRFLVAFYEVAGDPEPSAAMESFAVRQSLLRAWGEFQEQHPLVVAPVYTDIPFDAGSDLDDGRVAETIRGMRMTLAVSALGLPAVAVPTGVVEGMPQAVQIIGPRYREDLCLAAAEAIEARVGVFTPIDPR